MTWIEKADSFVETINSFHLFGCESDFVGRGNIFKQTLLFGCLGKWDCTSCNMPCNADLSWAFAFSACNLFDYWIFENIKVLDLLSTLLDCVIRTNGSIAFNFNAILVMEFNNSFLAQVWVHLNLVDSWSNLAACK